ncbi:CoA transferase [Mesorhizobium sp. M0312]|uniref:CaiB/BaiF CoA-transferase family protein n=1 Tax=Mesorhizobium sp. M0312 TaxID=2956934 RepID=UPI00333A9D86
MTNTEAYSEAPGPLDGFRVIDFGQYLAGPLTAMLLADQGAEVIRVDPRTGPLWQTPMNAVLNRGKKSIALDLKDSSDQEIARALVLSADVVIENFRPGVMDRLGLGEKWARAAKPSLIYLSLPGFAESDARRRQWRAWEGVVAAATSHYRDTGARTKLIEDRPVYTALPMASYYAGIQGAVAVSLGLLRKRTTGLGATAEVPLFNASISPLGYMGLFMKDVPARYPGPAGMPPGIAEILFREMRTRGEFAAMRQLYADSSNPFYFNYRCSDGRLFFLCASLTRLHIDRAIRVLGIAAMLDNLGMTRDNLYADLGRRVDKNIHAPDNWSKDDRELVREHLIKIFEKRPAHHWEQLFGDAGVPCTVHRTNEEYVKQDWVRDSELMVKVITPEYGPMWQPNRLVYFPGDGDQACDLAPSSRLDEDRQDIIGDLPRREEKSGSRQPVEGTSSGPLNGNRVLDFTNVISGPTCGRTLAECGAEVIKIDSPSPTHPPETAIILGFDVNRGKRSLLLDLKNPGAKDVLEKLVRTADVVIYNGPDPVLQRLGLTYDDLKEVNPRLIVCQLTAFGAPAAGPSARRQGYDEVVQSANGIQVRFGGPDDPLLHGSASCLDYSTGYIATFAILLALIRRGTTGMGSHVCTSLALAGQAVQLPYCFDYEGRGPWSEPRGQDALGSGPLNRIYNTADGWIFISLPSSEAERLVAVAELGVHGNETLEDLERTLEAVLATKTSTEWEDLLNPLQIGAQRLWSLAELKDAHIREIDAPDHFVDGDQMQSPVFLRYSHELGSIVEHLAPSWIRRDLGGLRMGAAAPRYGEHSEAILRELGYRAEEIAALICSGVVATQVTENGNYLPM